MSETPRTDAQANLTGAGGPPTWHIHADFARQLERELAEAREELIQWRTLRSWGGTPQIIDDFIKGQQSRIHAAQDAERQRDALVNILTDVINEDGTPKSIDRAAIFLTAVKGGRDE